MMYLKQQIYTTYHKVKCCPLRVKTELQSHYDITHANICFLSFLPHLKWHHRGVNAGLKHYLSGIGVGLNVELRHRTLRVCVHVLA